MSRRNIIGFSGAHGTGKTTAAYRYAGEQKLANPTKKIILLNETARECPLPINRGASRHAQVWIFAVQLAAEIEAANAYDIVIADRTAADVAAYTFALGYFDEARGMTFILRNHAAAYYRRIFFHTIKNNPFCYNDGVRDQDESFRACVEESMKCIYARILPDNDMLTKL